MTFDIVKWVNSLEPPEDEWIPECFESIEEYEQFLKEAEEDLMYDYERGGIR